MIDYNAIDALNNAVVQCREYLGDRYFLDELLRALDIDELRACIEWIARTNGIELEYEL